MTDGHITSELAIRTMQKALESQRLAKGGLILHSDQGCQYTPKVFMDFCESVHVIQSMSKARCPYDNAPMERNCTRQWREFAYVTYNPTYVHTAIMATARSRYTRRGQRHKERRKQVI